MKIECYACNGTGLYEGLCEEKDYPVICVRCNGTGAGIGSKPFTGRKKKKNIKGVRYNPTGSILTGGSKKTISYEEFVNRITEPKID